MRGCEGAHYINLHWGCIPGEDAIIDAGQMQWLYNIVLKVAQDEFVELRHEKRQKQQEQTQSYVNIVQKSSWFMRLKDNVLAVLRIIARYIHGLILALC